MRRRLTHFRYPYQNAYDWIVPLLMIQIPDNAQQGSGWQLKYSGLLLLWEMELQHLAFVLLHQHLVIEPVGERLISIFFPVN